MTFHSFSTHNDIFCNLSTLSFLSFNSSHFLIAKRKFLLIKMGHFLLPSPYEIETFNTCFTLFTACNIVKVIRYKVFFYNHHRNSLVSYITLSLPSFSLLSEAGYRRGNFHPADWSHMYHTRTFWRHKGMHTTSSNVYKAEK